MLLRNHVDQGCTNAASIKMYAVVYMEFKIFVSYMAAMHYINCMRILRKRDGQTDMWNLLE